MATFVVWRDPQRPIWGLDWPYQLTPTQVTPLSEGIPPSGLRVPIDVFNPQRPIYGIDWQYGYRIQSLAPAPSLAAPGVPPPGSPWGLTGAAAPELDVWGYYDQWPTQRGSQVASLVGPPFVPAPPPPESYSVYETIRAAWVEPTWQPPPFTAIATLVPKPPPTNPLPNQNYLLNLFQIRLAWPDQPWVVIQPPVQIATLQFIPPPPVPPLGTGPPLFIPPQLGKPVTTRTLSWLDMASRAWGSEFRAPDHRIYQFSGGNYKDSTDLGTTGIYSPNLGTPDNPPPKQ